MHKNIIKCLFMSFCDTVILGGGVYMWSRIGKMMNIIQDQMSALVTLKLYHARKCCFFPIYNFCHKKLQGIKS
jgi:hypothetical protein